MFEGIIVHNALNYLAGMAACTLFAASASAQSATDIRSRAQVYDKFFFPSGVPANYLDTPTAVKLPKDIRQNNRSD
jgi:hypothetical protein